MKAVPSGIFYVNGNPCQFCPPPSNQTHTHKEVYKTFNSVLNKVTYGRYQIYMWILFFYSALMWYGDSMLDDKLGFIPDWHCNDSSLNALELANAEFAISRDQGRRFNSRKSDEMDVCKQECSLSDIVPLDYYFHSIISEWTLVCERERYLLYSDLIQCLCRMAGLLVGGHIGDNLGRKRLLFACQFVICLSGVMTTAARSMLAYTIFRAILTFSLGVSLPLAFSLIVEITMNKYRFIAICAFHTGVDTLVITLIAYLTKDWQLYLIVLHLVTVPLLLGYLIIYESPAWLIQRKQQFQHAADILTAISSDLWNNVSVRFTKREMKHLRKADGNGKQRGGWYHLGHLFSTRQLCKMTCMQVLARASTNCVRRSIVGNMIFQFNNPFLNAAIAGLVMMCMTLMGIFLDWRFRVGRRRLFLGSLCLLVVSYAVVTGTEVALHQAEEDTFHTWLITICILIGYSVTMSVYALSATLIIEEWYPLAIRNVALGGIFAMAKLPELVVIVLVRSTSAQASSTVIPFAFALGISALTLLVAVFWQVETHNMALVDTIPELSQPRHLISIYDASEAPPSSAERI